MTHAHFSASPLVDPAPARGLEAAVRRSLEPRRWSRRARRAFLATAPVSFPAFGAYYALTLVALGTFAALAPLFERTASLWDDA